MNKDRDLNWVQILGLVIGILGLIQFPLWWSARAGGEPHGGFFIFVGAAACSVAGATLYLLGIWVRVLRAQRTQD